MIIDDDFDDYFLLWWKYAFHHINLLSNRLQKQLWRQWQHFKQLQQQQSTIPQRAMRRMIIGWNTRLSLALLQQCWLSALLSPSWLAGSKASGKKLRNDRSTCRDDGSMFAPREFQFEQLALRSLAPKPYLWLHLSSSAVKCKIIFYCGTCMIQIHNPNCVMSLLA